MKVINIERAELAKYVKKHGDKIRFIVPCNPCTSPTELVLVVDDDVE